MKRFTVPLCGFILLTFFTSVRAQVAGDPSPAKSFRNPVKIIPTLDCSARNIDADRFDVSYAGDIYSPEDKIEICRGLEIFIEHSRRAETFAGPELRERMHALWNTLINSRVKIIPLPQKLKNSMFVASAAYPRKVRAEVYQAAVYIPAERVTSDLFFYALWHELQHVRDLESAWENYQRITNYELEYNGFYMASLLAEVYQPKQWITGQPAFWEDSWKVLPAAERDALRTRSIDQYIRNSPVLKDAWDQRRADYDFSRRKN